MAETPIDTHIGISWKHLEELLVGRSFEKVHSHDIVFRDDDVKTDEYAMWIRREDGLVVCAESYGDSVNKADLAYELQAPVTLEQLRARDGDMSRYFDMIVHHRNGGSGFQTIDGKEIGGVSKDILRQPLLGYLGLLEHAKKSGLLFDNPWQVVAPWELGLMNDRHVVDISSILGGIRGAKLSGEVRQMLLSSLPADIKKMINYRPQNYLF